MRTKAEAIENPMPGDRWRVWTEREVSDFDGEFVLLNSFDGQWSWPLAAFRRWAATAKFLGGAE